VSITCRGGCLNAAFLSADMFFFPGGERGTVKQKGSAIRAGGWWQRKKPKTEERNVRTAYETASDPNCPPFHDLRAHGRMRKKVWASVIRVHIPWRSVREAEGSKICLTRLGSNQMEVKQSVTVVANKSETQAQFFIMDRERLCSCYARCYMYHRSWRSPWVTLISSGTKGSGIVS